jgi:predicted metal-dependent hydrolase
MTSLVLGDLQFEVRRSGRRRTLGLTVERDGSLVLSAPPDVADTRLERFARQKRFWIYEKLAAKEALPPALPVRKFVTGEGFPYLGRSHRLQLVADLDVPVKLDAGRFKMRRKETVHGRAAMVRWYTVHAQPWLASRVTRYADRVNVEPGVVTVQYLGYRWGPAARVAGSISTGRASCSRPASSTTSWCTSSSTCASRTTRRNSGVRSNAPCRTGRGGASGLPNMGAPSWYSGIGRRSSAKLDR